MAEDKSGLIRAFICIEISDSAIKESARIQEILSNKKFTGKMTELENLHLTLKFLGELDSETIEKVKEKLSRVEFDEFECTLGIIGTFSVLGKPRIVWIKINGKELWDLQKKIDDSLQDLFAKEERFMSHMTIARVKYVKDKKDFVDYIKNIAVKEIKFRVNCFKLKSSDLRRIGPVYADIEEYKHKEKS